MANQKTGKFKTESERDTLISLRLSKQEIEFIDQLCLSRKNSGSKYHSRSDIIILACRFALGELSLLERMELNLSEGKGIFDRANFPEPNKYLPGFNEYKL